MILPYAPCALLSLCAVVAMAADPVFLVDETDTRHGPFELKANTELPLRGHVYRVEGLPDEAKDLMLQLQQTKLPPFQFTEARLPELVQFVRENAAKQNPQLAGIGFLIVDVPPKANPQDPEPSAEPAAASPGTPPASPVAADPRPAKISVSFQGGAMTVSDLLTTAADLFGYRLDVDAKMVRLVNPRLPSGRLYRRMYNVLPTLVERLVDFRGDHNSEFCTCSPMPMAGAHRHSDMMQWELFFEDFGVRWPEGSFAQYLPTIGKLACVNTLKNHRLLETALGVLNVTPKQIEIDFQFVALPRAAVEKAARSGRVSSSAVLALVRDGQGTLLACPKVVTKNGSEAMIKGVVEIIYPSEFTVGGSGSAATNAVPSADGTAVEPGGFETREIGAILQVVPDVIPEGTIINLTLAPQVVYPPEWRNYAMPVAEDGKEQQPRPAPMELPFFPVDSIATSVQIYNGSTIVIGGGTPSKDGQTFTYILVSARLVDPNGDEVGTESDRDTFEPVSASGE